MRRSNHVDENKFILGNIGPVRLNSLCNTRRGHAGRITKIINNIFKHLQDGFLDEVNKLYQELLITFAKFKAINTEYLCYEVDGVRIKEAESLFVREENRIKEVKSIIDEITQHFRILPEEDL